MAFFSILQLVSFCKLIGHYVVSFSDDFFLHSTWHLHPHGSALRQRLPSAFDEFVTNHCLIPALLFWLVSSSTEFRDLSNPSISSPLIDLLFHRWISHYVNYVLLKRNSHYDFFLLDRCDYSKETYRFNVYKSCFKWKRHHEFFGVYPDYSKKTYDKLVNILECLMFIGEEFRFWQFPNTDLSSYSLEENSSFGSFLVRICLMFWFGYRFPISLGPYLSSCWTRIILGAYINPLEWPFKDESRIQEKFCFPALRVMTEISPYNSYIFFSVFNKNFSLPPRGRRHIAEPR